MWIFPPILTLLLLSGFCNHAPGTPRFCVRKDRCAFSFQRFELGIRGQAWKPAPTGSSSLLNAKPPRMSGQLSSPQQLNHYAIAMGFVHRSGISAVSLRACLYWCSRFIQNDAGGPSVLSNNSAKFVVIASSPQIIRHKLVCESFVCLQNSAWESARSRRRSARVAPGGVDGKYCNSG
jgi:hypothetical protein